MTNKKQSRGNSPGLFFIQAPPEIWTGPARRPGEIRPGASWTMLGKAPPENCKP